MLYSKIKDINTFDNYFRHLYRIIKFVDETPLLKSSDDKSEDPNGDEMRGNYVDLVRSTLSDYELAVLFYNCLTTNGRAKFKPLIEKYTLFNNLRTDYLVKREDILEYDGKAYDKNILIDAYVDALSTQTSNEADA